MDRQRQSQSIIQTDSQIKIACKQNLVKARNFQERERIESSKIADDLTEYRLGPYTFKTRSLNIADKFQPYRQIPDRAKTERWSSLRAQTGSSHSPYWIQRESR